MRARVFFVSILAAALLLNGCRKEEPVSITGNPVFYVDGTLNGSPLQISAGVNNYYMYSSYSSDSSNVHVFTGDLRTDGSSTLSPLSLKVSLRDYATHGIQPNNIDSALYPGAFGFVPPGTVASNSIAFTSVPQGDSVLSYSWSFGDNATSTLADPVHTYNAPGQYNVCLNINYLVNNQACSDSYCETITVGTTPCMNVDFTATNIDVVNNFFNDSVYFVSSVTGGTPPYSYQWYFGDTASSTTPVSVIHNYIYPAMYTVQLIVTDAQNCSVTRTKKIGTSQWSGCLTNFNWQPVPASPLNLSQVVLSWTDAAGNSYSSDGGTQPPGSSFQVVSVGEYQANENGQRTKKVRMLVTCTLFRGSNTLLLQNATIVFSVAYP